MSTEVADSFVEALVEIHAEDGKSRRVMASFDTCDPPPWGSWTDVLKRDPFS